MKSFFIACLVIAAFALFPNPSAQAVLATAASTLFESTPFILAGALLAGVAPRRGALAVCLLGCGCGSGPAARSLPLAAATWLIFGPAVAVTRWIAACVAAFALRPRSCDHPERSFPGELRALLPFALLAGSALTLTPRIPFTGMPAPLAALLGAAVAIVASPCGFGGLALASTLHTFAPAGTAGVLATAGIFDLHAFSRFRTQVGNAHDACAYLLAAVACALVAAHHGALLVNPRFTLPLAASAMLLLANAWRYRTRSAPATRWPALLMLAAAVLAAPPPVYYAAQTTLADAFPGERLDFIGVLTDGAQGASLVRYSITCCRADAQPVAVRLASAIHEARGQWIEAHGTLTREQDALVLQVDGYRPIAAPADPFLYR